MAEERRPNETRTPINQGKRRFLFIVVYSIIGLIFALGVYLIVLQFFVIVPPIETPPSYEPTPTPVLMPPNAGMQNAEDTDSSTPEPTPEPTPEIRILPVRVYFTKPGYWSEVFPTEPILLEDGGLEIGTVDSANDCAWHTLSAAPLEEGNCILSGHERFSKKKGVFSYLKKIEYGEEVVVELDNGEFVYYEVGDIQVFHRDEIPAVYLSQSGRNRLTLITCKGDRVDGQSLSRVVVVCTRKNG